MKGIVWAVVAAAVLVACDREERLEGERRALFADERTEIGPQPIALPAQTSTSNWTEVNGGPEHKLGHLALRETITRVWSADIGTGNTRRSRITSSPVVVGGTVYTLDSRSQVSAVTNGAVAWTRDLTPPTERASDASGGGIAYGAGRLYAATGFGELVAIDPANGGVIWRQDLQGAAGGAPSVRGDTVYVVNRGGRAYALDAASGRIRWELTGLSDAAGIAGAAGPAVSGSLAVFPFGSGEILTTDPTTGERRWAASVRGGRADRAFGGITDIAASPVIDGGRVYVGNATGRIAALDAETGLSDWTAQTGALGPVWPVGGSLFLVSDVGELVRLDAATGQTIWAEELPYFQRARPLRRNAVFAHYGPVLAGGRLLVASSDGQLRSFSPESGQLLSAVEIPGGAASAPVVVDQTLYVLSGRGQLHAYR